MVKDLKIKFTWNHSALEIIENIFYDKGMLESILFSRVLQCVHAHKYSSSEE